MWSQQHFLSKLATREHELATRFLEVVRMKKRILITMLNSVTDAF